jgi:outer membrane protein insertion porin family
MGENDNYALRTDYGFGFRWFSPIGVLRFEFGFPVNPRKNEAGNQFNFDIGQLF